MLKIGESGSGVFWSFFQSETDLNVKPKTIKPRRKHREIGRASCRERV